LNRQSKRSRIKGRAILAKYRIKQTQFCSLSREKEWQNWLESIAPHLYQELIGHLSLDLGCGSNKLKMIEIQNRLIELNLGSKLIQFLQDHYSFVLEVVRTKEDILIRKSLKTLLLNKAPMTPKVFEYYNPNIMTFPHKKIFYNSDVDVLKKDVLRFCVDKIGFDFLIIGSYAFVEFFLQEYKSESDKIDNKKRELYKFRLSHGMARLPFALTVQPGS